ncbi:unnamed protein product [Gulo gulo]|uniref:Uncharacterized protein n=1 Tax=Gulo gulo TaxID=48420 RepID=A0A9X9LLX3_GULGU|nr:unnamed protein product [Gulo gulo]
MAQCPPVCAQTASAPVHCRAARTPGRAAAAAMAAGCSPVPGFGGHLVHMRRWLPRSVGRTTRRPSAPLRLEWVAEALPAGPLQRLRKL